MSKRIIECFKCHKPTNITLLIDPSGDIDLTNIRVVCSECTGRKKNNKYNVKKGSKNTDDDVNQHCHDVIVGETIVDGIEEDISEED